METVESLKSDLEKTKAELSKWQAIFQESGTNEPPEPEKIEKKWKALLTEVRDLKMREPTVVLRLTKKEQELHELKAQLSDMKRNHIPHASKIKDTMLDPTVNNYFKILKEELDNTKTQLQKARDDLEAVQFTKQSAIGKRLLARVRLFQKENETLGQKLAEGERHKLETELQLRLNHNEQLKQSLAECTDWILMLREEVLYLQGKLGKGTVEVKQPAPVEETQAIQENEAGESMDVDT